MLDEAGVGGGDIERNMDLASLALREPEKGQNHGCVEVQTAKRHPKTQGQAGESAGSQTHLNTTQASPLVTREGLPSEPTTCCKGGWLKTMVSCAP